MGNISQLRIGIFVVALIFHVMIRAEIANREGGGNNLLVPTNSSVPSENIADDDSGEVSSTSSHGEILAANRVLQSRVEALEKRLEAFETLLTSLSLDAQFYHPTSEVQYVDMEVVHWDEAVKNSLRSVSIPFQAGFVTGAASNWEFSLASENDAVTVNLLLIEQSYNRRAIFAGFTAYVLNSEGNIYSQAYSGTKDVQTVVFDVANLFDKVEERKENNSLTATLPLENRQPLAYTKFVLTHEPWNMDTNWSAELFDGDNGDSLSFHVILEQCKWSKLYASFYMEVWDSQKKQLLHKQATPVNDFMKDRITVDPLFIVDNLKEDYSEMPTMLQFKLQFIVYGKNARYYSDVI